MTRPLSHSPRPHSSVLGASALLRIAVTAAGLAPLWLAVAWAVALP